MTSDQNSGLSRRARQRLKFIRNLLLALLAISAWQYATHGRISWPAEVFRQVEEIARDAFRKLDGSVGVPEYDTPENGSPPGGSGAPEAATLARVVKVLDGDSLRVRNQQGTVEVRLYGVDAPEWGQPYGEEAKRLLERLVAGANVEIARVEIDNYGRTVARVYRGNKFINEELVRSGAAWWYRRYADDEYRLERAQQAARAAQLGLWQAPDPVPPWEWRRSH
ncbi:hypothetical protein E4634_11865 [Mangrovimicrobium sediminis]|uniref:TNase-like domain-containing protein n=1 Tax=Mangrovimicrobium sediminis TaxID=2562682 RepID=A0A4Z0M0J6_9GAMM|nr:thermonuclease family protein [Haliea sp. SAOS-164]TGD72976.1 hypothetical protein E4634_11865 [Haliea sp. SAOS-164]